MAMEFDSTNTKLVLLFCVVLSLAGGGGALFLGPPEMGYCSAVIMNLTDCWSSYVSNSSSTLSKPQGACCSVLKLALDTDSECLCGAFRSGVRYGVVFNVTKVAAVLPAACRLPASPFLTNCARVVDPSYPPTPLISGEDGPRGIPLHFPPEQSGCAKLNVSLAALLGAVAMAALGLL